MCLPRPKEVGRIGAAIQRDDQIVLIGACDRVHKASPRADNDRALPARCQFNCCDGGGGVQVFLRSSDRCDAGHQRGLGLAHMPLLVTQSVERTLRHFAFQLE